MNHAQTMRSGLLFVLDKYANTAPISNRRAGYHPAHKRASFLHFSAIGREIPEPGGPPDPRLRLLSVDPSGVIEDLPLAQTYRVPTGRRMIPIAGQHAGQRRAAHIQIGGIVGP